MQWIEADISVWEPGTQFDLVTTHYAHPAIAQLAFYERISGWVAPGGTLLIVGHLHTSDTPGHGHNPPEEVAVTAATITAGLDATDWDIVTADERIRTLTDRRGPDRPVGRRRRARHSTPLSAVVKGNRPGSTPDARF